MAAKAVLDPQMKILLDTFNAAGPMFLRAETAEQARAKMRAMLEANPIPVEPIYRVEDRSSPGRCRRDPGSRLHSRRKSADGRAGLFSRRRMGARRFGES